MAYLLYLACAAVTSSKYKHDHYGLSKRGCRHGSNDGDVLILLQEHSGGGRGHRRRAEALMESLDRDDATDPESAESFALIPGLKAHLHNTTLEHLLDDPEVELIEADCFVRLGAAQSHPSWHLDRSDSCSPQCNEPPFDQAYDYGLADGRGAWVYVLDTGIRISHSEFGGRASGGYSPKCFEWASSHCTHNGGKYAYERASSLMRSTLRPQRRSVWTAALSTALIALAQWRGSGTVWPRGRGSYRWACSTVRATDSSPT